MPNFIRGVSEIASESPQPVFVFQDTAISGSPDIVKSIPGTLFSIQVDARLSTVPVFIQIFDNLTPVVGSTAADEIIEAAPYVITTADYTTSAGLGKSFSNAITVAATNILTGAVGPSANVVVTILYQ